MDSPALPQSGVAAPVAAAPVAAPASAPWRRKAFDIKGTMATLTVLKLHSTDLMLIERQLRRKIAEQPQLFLHAPVLLDFAELEQPEALSLPALVSLMKSFKLVPVGGANVPAGIRNMVTGAGLGVLAPGATARPRAPRVAEEYDADKTPAVVVVEAKPERRPEPPPPPPPAAAAVVAARAPFAGPMVVNQPVRSGQVIYAQNNDLVVMAPVNAGAQVIADGHVHIYATLRGRAVAGAQGLPGARLFVQKLEAELIAIAGAYMMSDEIPAPARGRAVQVYLEGGQCRIAPL